MMTRSVKVDLLELFQTGLSGPIKLGKTNLDELSLTLQDPDANVWKSWQSEVEIPTNTTSDSFEFEFTEESRPRLRRLKAKIQYLGGIWGTSGVVQEELEHLKSGKIIWHFGKLKWIKLQSLPDAIHALERDSFRISSGSEKQIYLVWASGKRQLIFEYHLQPLAREGNYYEFDYFLNTIQLCDYGQYRMAQKAIDKIFKEMT